MALHINWLGEARMIKLEVQSSKKGQGRESLQYLLLYYFIHAVLVIIVINAITYTDYTQYINTYNRGQAHPPQYYSICLVNRRSESSREGEWINDQMLFGFFQSFWSFSKYLPIKYY